MPRMMVATGLYKQLLIDDPNTAMTLSGIRRLIRQEVIPSVDIGRKKLVDYNLFIAYLQSPTVERAQTQQGQVRMVV